MAERGLKKWLNNAIRFYTQKNLIKNREPYTWGFASWEGNRFSDNSKALYDYISYNYPQIRCVIFVKKLDLYEQIHKQGKEVYLIGTDESNKMQKKLGVCFYTNGIDDYGDYPYIFGSIIVSLWHGVGFKRIYGSDLIAKHNKLLIFLAKLKNKIFSFVYRDITCTTSDFMKKISIEEFYLPDDSNIFLTGQPRNDIFKRNIQIEECIRNKYIEDKISNKKIITFMPTYQSYQSEAELKATISELDSNEEFISFMRENNYIFTVKMHYLVKIDINLFKNIFVLNDEDVSDTQSLLLNTSILITDYSSVFADYALLERPILFFRPNDESYLKQAGLFDEYQKCCSINVAKNIDELTKNIIDIINKKVDYKEQNKVINDYFEDSSIKNTCYSQNVTKSILKYILIKNKNNIH